jgi:hypothetical protein
VEQPTISTGNPTSQVAVYQKQSLSRILFDETITIQSLPTVVVAGCGMHSRKLGGGMADRT